MGHFSHNCKLTSLPITGGDEVALIVMKPVDNLYDNSEESLKQYGSTYMCSNNGTRLKFIPCWFPIRGKYDSYGGIEDIVKDDNIKVLEEHYGLSIEEILGIVTSNRKDDGYDDALTVIKESIKNPYEYLEGENHFIYYQRITNDPQPFGGSYPQSNGDSFQIFEDGKFKTLTKKQYDAAHKLIQKHYARYQKWSKTNPDVEDDYGHPQYKEKYKDLLSLSGMWVRGDVYDKLTDTKVLDSWRDKLDFGNPELLKALGFEELPIDKTKDRYNRPFVKGNCTVYSDGTWLVNSIYNWQDFDKLVKKAGETIEYKEIDAKDLMEQTFDYIVPTINIEINTEDDIEYTEEDLKVRLEKYNSVAKNKMDLATLKEILEQKKYRDLNIDSSTLFYFMNTDLHHSQRIVNPITLEYLKHAKAGELRDNLVRFWRFDMYMHSCGIFYDIVGTGSQDGDHRNVLNVLTIATDILKEDLKRWGDEEPEDEEDDE